MTRQPPNDLDAERVVLGALLSGAGLDDAGPLESGDFYRPAHQIIFEAICDLDGAGSPRDPVAVNDELRRRGELGRMGGAPYLHTCLESVPSRAMIGHYAGIVRDHALRRRVDEIAARLHQAVMMPGDRADLLERMSESAGVLVREAGPGPRGGTRVIRLSDVEPERIDWLWRGYLPRRKVVILDGDPGLGKSVLTVDLAARVSKGLSMPDGADPVKGAVLLLSAEDGLADTIRPRLDAAGADPDQVITITEIAGRPVTVPGDLPDIEKVITGNGVVLVVVDVLMAYLDGEVNSFRDQDVRRALRPLAAMAERTGCCVVVIRHLNKSGGQIAVYRGGGSIGIVGAARAAFIVGADPEDETGETRVLAAVKSNLAKAPPALAYRLAEDEQLGCVKIEWLGKSSRTADALLAERGSEEERAERDEAVEWLEGYLGDEKRGGEDKAGDIIKAAIKDGIAERTLQRARRKGPFTTAKAGFGQGWVWRLDYEGATKAPKAPPFQDEAPSAPSGAFGEDDGDAEGDAGEVPPDW
jgi:AAA domain/DnaB-like helicase N terminal domain